MLSFFSSRVHPRHHPKFRQVTFGYFSLWQFLTLLVFWGPWRFWGWSFRWFVESNTMRRGLTCLSGLSWGYGAFERRKQSAIVFTFYQGTCCQHNLFIVDVDLDYLDCIGFVRFLHCKEFFFFHFSYCTIWKEVTYVKSMVKE